MRKAFPVRWAILGCALSLGCSTMRPGGKNHPGVEDPNPKAVNRVYPASATRVAWAMGRVMTKDPILDEVKVMVDPQSNESRPLSVAEREKLGVSKHKVGSKDVNYDITAKSKDGHRVGAVIALKGESEAEVSLLYGPGGDPELSKAILDEVEAALAEPATDPGVSRASAAKPSPRPTVPR